MTWNSFDQATSRGRHDTLSGHIVDIGEQQAELRDSQATTSALSELEERFLQQVSNLADRSEVFGNGVDMLTERLDDASRVADMFSVRLDRHREDINRLRGGATLQGWS